MVGLPYEIIDAIIREHKNAWGRASLAALATINRDWQTVVEDYTWHYLRITSQRLEHFHSVFRENPSRRRSVKTLFIYFEDYFAKEDQKQEKKHNRDGESTGRGTSDRSNDIPHSGDHDSEDCGKSSVVTSDGNCQGEGDERQTPLMRLTAFQHEHARFFREVKTIWNELASWKDDLRITEICFDVKGYSIYDFVGSEVCNGEGLGNSTLLDFASFPSLPLLPSVRDLSVREETDREMDLWPAIVTSSVASSLPMLECLEAVGIEYESRWPLVRKCLRQALANQIWNLPTSLRTLHLCLDYHDAHYPQLRPSNFLVGGLDCPSISIRHISTHLTTLVVRLTYVSAALFWDPDVSDNSCATAWPNLRILDISTGLERPTGDYWLLSAAEYPEHEHFDYPEPDASNSDDPDSETYQLTRPYASREFHTRPNPKLFDELAISIARAAARMPKLEYIDLEFNASHQGRTFHGGYDQSVHQYKGWAFYYRASNDARFASEYPKPYFFGHEPGVDRTYIERPRTEWVFQYPYGQLHWEEPEVSKALWREKCTRIDFDMVMLGQGGRLWERRRNREVIPLL